MRNMRPIPIAVGSVIAFSAVAYMLSIGLTHPDMAQGRLVLTFWPQYLAGLIVGFVGAGIIVLWGEDED